MQFTPLASAWSPRSCTCRLSVVAAQWKHSTAGQWVWLCHGGQMIHTCQTKEVPDSPSPPLRWQRHAGEAIPRQHCASLLCPPQGSAQTLGWGPWSSWGWSVLPSASLDNRQQPHPSSHELPELAQTFHPTHQAPAEPIQRCAEIAINHSQQRTASSHQRLSLSDGSCLHNYVSSDQACP